MSIELKTMDGVYFIVEPKQDSNVIIDIKETKLDAITIARAQKNPVKILQAKFTEMMVFGDYDGSDCLPGI